MVSLKSFLTTSAVLIAAFVSVEGAVSPTYPSPGTTQTTGTSYDITWTFDGNNATTTYQIDFMTGSNDAQVVLANVAKDVAANALKYTYVAPEVTPNAAIYFFMFTGSDGVSSWTTRFGIVGADGKLAAEPNKTQPNGDKIPWGTGKLVGAFASVSNSSASAASAVAVSSPAVSSPAVAVASPSPVPAASSSVPVVAAAAASGIPTVAQVAPASTNAGSMVKPALGFVSAVVVGYFAF